MTKIAKWKEIKTLCVSKQKHNVSPQMTKKQQTNGSNTQQDTTQRAQGELHYNSFDAGNI